MTWTFSVSSLQVLKEAVIQEGSPALLWDFSTGRPRPIVPVAWRHQVLDYSLPLASWGSCVCEAGRSQVRLAWPSSPGLYILASSSTTCTWTWMVLYLCRVLLTC